MTIDQLNIEPDPLSLEQIFHEWIEYLIDTGHVRKENINWKLLTQAITELELKAYINAGRKFH